MTDQKPDNTYTELGRFIEAFELLIMQLRNSCVIVLSSPAPKWQPLIRIPFYHAALTAKPLIDIFYAIMGTMINDIDTIKAVQLSQNEIDVFKGTLSQTTTDLEKLANKRNNIIHGTWLIGINPNPTDFSKFIVSKETTSGEGLKAVANLPRDVAELRTLTQECLRLRDWVGLLTPMFVVGWSIRITNLFRFDEKEKRWVRILPQ